MVNTMQESPILRYKIKWKKCLGKNNCEIDIEIKQ